MLDSAAVDAAPARAGDGPRASAVVTAAATMASWRSRSPASQYSLASRRMASTSAGGSPSAAVSHRPACSMASPS